MDLRATLAWLSASGISVERVGRRRLLLPSPLDGREGTLTIAWRPDVVQVTQAVLLVDRAARARAGVAISRANLELAVPGLILDERGLVSYRLAISATEPLTAVALARTMDAAVAVARRVRPELLACTRPPPQLLRAAAENFAHFA